MLMTSPNRQFLAVRAVFGLAMGGVYGNAVSMALENWSVFIFSATCVSSTHLCTAQLKPEA